MGQQFTVKKQTKKDLERIHKLVEKILLNMKEQKSVKVKKKRGRKRKK